jgi:hypothetical protein
LRPSIHSAVFFDSFPQRPGPVVRPNEPNLKEKSSSFSKDQRTAEVKLFNVSKQQPMHYRMSFTTSALSPFSEDASQAAARIVKQATEGH